MQFSVGDLIHSELTKEEGRILRVVNVGGRLAYVVAALNKSSGKETETLWRPKELKELRDRMRAKAHGDRPPTAQLAKTGHQQGG